MDKHNYVNLEDDYDFDDWDLKGDAQFVGNSNFKGFKQKLRRRISI
jgi:hypothetical protein